MTDDLNQVQGQPAEGVSAQAETPVSQEGVSKETPNQQPPVDVEKLKADYETKLSAYQRDLNQMKSSLQRREAQVNQEWQSRYEELQNQMHQVRMANMTDEERAKYERQLESEEMQTLQYQLEQMQNERQNMARTLDGIAFFTQKQGVPMDKLVLDQGYDAMVQSGWDYISSELMTLRQLASNPQPQSNQPAPLKQAPPVITDKGTPGSGTTWAALRQQYGSDEAVYRAVEEGRLPPSVIPS